MTENGEKEVDLVLGVREIGGFGVLGGFSRRKGVVKGDLGLA